MTTNQDKAVSRGRRFFRRDGRGQSLIEAIVALGILTTSISAALTLASQSVSAERDSAASITAGNLAREGVEVARLLRDSNWLAENDWDQGLYSSAGPDYTGIPVFDPATGDWSIDFTPNSFNDTDTTVYRRVTASDNATVGLFEQTTALPTGVIASGYQRLLTLNPICRAAGGGYDIITSGYCSTEKVGIQVISNVHWSFAGRSHSLTAEERLFDWR